MGLGAPFGHTKPTPSSHSNPPEPYGGSGLHLATPRARGSIWLYKTYTQFTLKPTCALWGSGLHLAIQITGGQQDGQLQFTTCSAGTNVGADGHTASNAPDLFRPPKLSGAGPGQYWGGGPPGKTLGCCQLLAASKTQQDGQAASKTASCNLPPVLPEHTHTLYIYLHPGHTEIY